MSDVRLRAMIREALASNDPMLGYKAFLESQRQGDDPISRVAVPAPEDPEDFLEEPKEDEDGLSYIDDKEQYYKSLTPKSEFNHMIEVFFDKIEFSSLESVSGFNREIFASVDIELRDGSLVFGEIKIEFPYDDPDDQDHQGDSEAQEEINKFKSQFESEVNKTLSDIGINYFLSIMKKIKVKNTMLKLRKYSESIVALQKEISEKQKVCGQAYLEKLKNE